MKKLSDTTMNEIEQRITIAERCGFWTEMEMHDEEIDKLPDYLNDLNAMHEAEEMLDRDQFFAYYHQLNALTLGTLFTIHASSAQRAEAFLKAGGLWNQ
jgi:hypothetical protein